MRADVVIIGGGVMGSAIAWFLSRDPDFTGSIVIVERDTAFTLASSSLSASSIRQQFTTPVSVNMSRFGWDFLRRADTLLGRPVGLVERGYLLLGNRATSGDDVELLDQTGLAHRFPWLQVDDLDSATFGLRHEGWFDGPALHRGLLESALHSGAKLIRGDASLICADGSISGVGIGEDARIEADVYVNACGAWAARLLEPLGVGLPISARKRDVYVFRCASELPSVPMVWDPSGLWFRPEGSDYLCGLAPTDDAPDAELIPDYARFDDELWPLLAARVPAFASIRMTGAWSGYYEHCDFDRNGFVGPTEAFDNLLLACGFSGHGMQHAPAVGRAISELIVHGEYRSLDLAHLHHSRVRRDAPLPEHQVA